MTLEEKAKRATVNELIKWSLWLPRILGPTYRAELSRRFGGTEITGHDIRVMKLAVDQFDLDH